MARTRLIPAAWTALLLGIAFVGATGLRPFYDDWFVPSVAAAAVRAGDVGAFLLSSVGRHWSPLWNLFALLNLRWAGWNSDLLVRGFTIVIQAASLLWCWTFLRSIGVSRGAVAFGMAILGLHHVSAAALYSFDTYSQVAADAATWVAGGLTYAALTAGGGFRDRRILVAVAMASAALLFKETALAGVIAVGFLSAAAWVLRSPEGAERRRALLVVATLIVVTLAFASARRAAGVEFDAAGDYRLCLTCAPRNMTLIAGAIALPVRTLTVVDAWRSMPRAWGVLGASAAGAGLVVMFLVAGLSRRARCEGLRVPTVMLVALLALTAFPVTLLGEIGELHAHTAVFWFAVLLAVAADEWARRIASVAVRTAGVVVLAAYVISLGVGLRANLRDMRESGDRASTWLQRYDDGIRDLPRGSTVLVRGPQPTSFPGDYSLYRMRSPERLALMWLWAPRDAQAGYPEVLMEWGNDDPGRLEEQARAGRLFELRRAGESLTIEPSRPSR